jgi:spoIIIJ-associated protein
MMLDLADATVVLNSLVALLKNCAGLDLTVKVHHPHTTGDPSQPDLMVELAGSDTPLLLQRDGELLHAFEHLACASLHLQPDDLPRIAFDANGFRANRARHLELLAEQAVSEVRLTHEPHVFPP